MNQTDILNHLEGEARLSEVPTDVLSGIAVFFGDLHSIPEISSELTIEDAVLFGEHLLNSRKAELALEQGQRTKTPYDFLQDAAKSLLYPKVNESGHKVIQDCITRLSFSPVNNTSHTDITIVKITEVGVITPLEPTMPQSILLDQFNKLLPLLGDEGLLDYEGLRKNP